MIMTKRILGTLALVLFLGGALAVILPADPSWAEGDAGSSSGSSNDDSSNDGRGTGGSGGVGA
jgi:hypothetical protein